MKDKTIETFTLCFLLVLPVGLCVAETDSIMLQPQEPQLYDHFVTMQRTQEGLSRLSLEEKERLQSKVRGAELRACQRLRQDRQEGVRDDEYRRQGGVEFEAYVLQFEKYCETLR